MASTAVWTFITATPFSAVYQITNPGTGDGTLWYSHALPLPSDPMNLHLAEGPLKAELARLNATNSLEELNNDPSDTDDSARVRIYYVTGVDYPITVPATLMVKWWSNGLYTENTGLGGEGDAGPYIEIRFEHSRQR